MSWLALPNWTLSVPRTWLCSNNLVGLRLTLLIQINSISTRILVNDYAICSLVLSVKQAGEYTNKHSTHSSVSFFVVCVQKFQSISKASKSISPHMSCVFFLIVLFLDYIYCKATLANVWKLEVLIIPWYKEPVSVTRLPLWGALI